MRFAIVVQIHPQRRTLDLVFTDTGLRVAEVACLSGMVANDSGVWDIPNVKKPTNEAQAGALPQSGRQLVAAVDEAYGRPVIVGFLQPLAGQLAFTQDDRFVRLFGSGVYWTVAPDGSVELWHPSGSFMRIGTGSHEPLAPIAANQNWQEIATAPAPTITLHTAKFTLTVAPDGTVTLNTQKSVNVTAPNGVAITANVAITGALTATGNITAGQGGASVELLHHSHSNSGGTGTSGPPVPGS